MRIVHHVPGTDRVRRTARSYETVSGGAPRADAYRPADAALRAPRSCSITEGRCLGLLRRRSREIAARTIEFLRTHLA